MHVSSGTRLADRYVVEGRIGAGGMATVYRVRHAELGSHHALKVLAGAASADRLRKEGRAQGGLRHPHVVAVSDMVSLDGRPCLVMEYVDGPSLDRVLARRRLTLDEADLVARGVLEGMAAAHAAGLVHRDLKPANVLLAPGPGRLIPKVADFGLVKAEDERDTAGLTQTGAVMGTPAYMSPEQIRSSSRVDARGDVWSLGALLYELLSGQRPFHGFDTLELYQRIAYGRYTPLAEVRPELPARMLRAVDGALQVHRDARWSTAGELLTAWLGDPPAPPPAWSAALLHDAAAMAPELEVLGPPASDGATFGFGQSAAAATFETGPSLAPVGAPSQPSLAPVAPDTPASAPAPAVLLAPAPALPTVLAAPLAALGGGLLAGAAVALTLAGADLSATYPGWPTLPVGTSQLGGALAMLVTVAAGALAARLAGRGAGVGAVTGFLAGLLASGLGTGPAAVILGCRGILASLAVAEPDQDLVVAAVTNLVTNVFWGVTAAYYGTLALGTGLGAVGGGLVQLLGGGAPAQAPAEVPPNLGLHGIVVEIAACLMLVVETGATLELERSMRNATALPSLVDTVSAIPLVHCLPWLLGGGLLSHWSGAHWLGARDDRRARRRGWLQLAVPVLLPAVLLLGSLGRDDAAQVQAGLALVLVALAASAATAAAWARRHPRPRPGAPSVRVIAGEALAMALLVPGFAWGSALVAAMGLALLGVPYLPALTDGGAVPAPIEQVHTLGRWTLGILGVLPVLFLYTFVVGLGERWWARRRAARQQAA